MGLFGGKKSPAETYYQRLDVLMSLAPGAWYQSGTPDRAAVRSTFYRPLNMPDADELTGRCILTALLVGRILVAHKETREELGSRIFNAAHESIDSGVLKLPPWTLVTEASAYQLWPWAIVPAESLTSANVYVAHLGMVAIGGRRLPFIDLRMGGSFRDTRVLAPSAPLIALQTLADLIAMQGANLRMVTLLLLGMCDYWNRAPYSMGSESLALASAFDMIQRMFPHAAQD